MARLGHADCYEVMIVRRHNGFSVGGRRVEASEYLPRDEDFGHYGWYYNSKTEATEKFNELTKGNK